MNCSTFNVPVQQRLTNPEFIAVQLILMALKLDLKG